MSGMPGDKLRIALLGTRGVRPRPAHLATGPRRTAAQASARNRVDFDGWMQCSA
jgi:hypothetical protein